MSSQKDNRQANLTRGIRVEIASLVYNIIEVVVSVTVGLLTGSAALVSWGLDSTVEATSAATLIWRLKGEKDGAGKRTVLHRKKFALYVVACAFWIVVAAALVVVGLANRDPVTLRAMPDALARLVGVSPDVQLPLFLVIQPQILRKRHGKNGHIDAMAIHVIIQTLEICQQKQCVAVAHNAFFDGAQAWLHRRYFNIAAGGALHE